MNRLDFASAVMAGLGVLAATAPALAQPVDAPANSAPAATNSAPTATPPPPGATPPAPAAPNPVAAPETPVPAPTVSTDPATGAFAFPGVLPDSDGFGFAQSSALAPLDPTTILNPLALGSSLVRRVIISPSVTATYDSNVARGSQSIVAQRGLASGSDEIISPAVTLDLNQPVGRGAAFLVGSVGYNFYVQDKALDRETLNLSGGYSAEVGACRGTGSVGYSRSLNQLTDVLRGSVEDTYSLVRVSGNVGCGGPIGFSPVASVSESFSQNSQSQLASSDLRTFSASAGLAYQTPNNGALSLFGQYQNTDFPNRTVTLLPGAETDGYKLYAGGIKYSRNLGARIQGTVSASYTITDSPGAPSFKGITYSVNANYRASSRLSFSGSFSRRVTPSNVLDATYTVGDYRSLEATYSHGYRWTVSLGVAEAIAQENGAALISALDLQNYDDKSIFATANYSLRRVNFSFTLRNDRRTSNQYLLNYSDTRASIRASTSF